MKYIIVLFINFLPFYVLAQNVGIDESNPSGKLHIKSNSTWTVPQLRLTEDSNDDYARIKLETVGHPNAFWDLAAKADTLSDFAQLNFFFSNTSNAGDLLTIRGNGNVGIGTINPLSKLDIANSGDGAELLRFTTDRPWVFKQTRSGFLANLTLQSTVGDKIFEIVSADSSWVTASFLTSDINPKAYLIPAKGRLGVGTYNPNARMAVEGDPNVSENIIRVNVNFNGQNDLAGIDCDSYPADGYGVGANFRGGHRGVRGLSDGKDVDRLSIGVVGAGYGFGDVGTRVGLWGNAYGGATNWAGYFDNGNVYVKEELRIGSGAQDGASGYRVAVDGKMIAEELRVELSGDWPDYVFEEHYDLPSLYEVQKEIKKLGHLPGIPSAQEVEEEGIMLGDMNRMLLEKIEELTLYTIQLQKEIDKLKKQVDLKD